MSGLPAPGGKDDPLLTDYLDGDNYFHIRYPEQNLDRCRTQFKLVADMEDKWAQMHEIVKELS